MLDKGGKGFPTLGFLDADGELLADHAGPHTVKGLRATKAGVERYREAAARAAEGDAKARVEALLLRCELGRMPYDDLDMELEDLGPLDEAQTARLAGLRANGAVDDMIAILRQQRFSGEARTMAGEAFLELLEEGARPVGHQQRPFFWQMLGEYAASEGRADTLTVCVEELGKLAADEDYADNERLAPLAEKLAGRLAELKER